MHLDIICRYMDIYMKLFNWVCEYWPIPSLIVTCCIIKKRVNSDNHIQVMCICTIHAFWIMHFPI